MEKWINNFRQAQSKPQDIGSAFEHQESISDQEEVVDATVKELLKRLDLPS